MDVKRAAELYAQGWTLSQIGAELDVRSNVFMIISVAPVSPCVPSAHRLTQPPPKRSSTCVTKV